MSPGMRLLGEGVGLHLLICHVCWQIRSRVEKACFFCQSPCHSAYSY